MQRSATRGMRDQELEQLCSDWLTRAGAPGMQGTIKVLWNSRLRTTAGLACYQSRTISLNPRLREIGTKEVKRTLKHELAHFLAAHRAGRKRIPPHGEAWQQACADLGIPGEARCHTLPFPRKKKVAKYFYECPACAAVLRRVRPLSGPSACIICCRKHSQGRYDSRFRFVSLQNGKPRQSIFDFFRRPA